MFKSSSCLVVSQLNRINQWVLSVRLGIKNFVLAEENVSIFIGVQILRQESLYCYDLPAWAWPFFIQ